MDDIITDGRPGAQAMKAAALEILETPTGFLSLHGPNGTGKTLALQAMVNALVDAGIDARYMMALDLTEMVKAAMRSERDSPYEVIQRLAGVQFLAIDEMDKGGWSDYNTIVCNFFFDKRYRDSLRLGTVLAWNGSFESLPVPSILSRLSQFPHVFVGDADMRAALGALR